MYMCVCVCVCVCVSVYIHCDVVDCRESEGEVNTSTPLALNQQALRKIGRQGPTVKVVGERNCKLTTSLAL